MALRDTSPGDLDAIDEDLTARNCSESSQRFDELRLAISFNSRDSQYLARADLEGDTIDNSATVRSG